MADINVPLLVALGDRAAPQHKVRGQEAFEFSEGSDGALHTKIVDQNGNPISSSNKLQVADVDVKAELEQIKQQQQQILQRLNQPIDTQLTGSNAENTRHNIHEIYKTINIIAREKTDKRIYGAYWDKTFDPTLTRTDDAEGLVANVGIDGEYVQNDFDNLPIWGEMGQVRDEFGNIFIQVPKFYIQKKSGKNFYLIRVSKYPHAGFYLPYLFWDFDKEKELDYALIGAHEASLSNDGQRIESKPFRHPLVERTIVEFRDLARANGKGYQQNDIHAIDILRTLFHIEFATIHSQSVALGYTNLNYSANHTITVAENNTNRAIVSNGTASNYEVGQTFGIGINQYSNTVTGTSRTIIAIEPYDENNTAIYFDGEPVNTNVGDVVANRGAITGFSQDILASSGTLNENNGKNPFVYRGIENPFCSVYEWIDGVNINNHQVWVCKNADDYTSNVFASPYEMLGYINHEENGYVTEMGFDQNYPFAEFPIAVGGNSATFYADYYYQNTGQRVARFGGYWSLGSYAGLSFWNLAASSGHRTAADGARLLKKPL